MRIGIIASSLNKPGGQAVQALDLVHGLRKEGILIDFLPIDPKLNGIFGSLQRYKYIRTIITSIAYVKSLMTHVPAFDVLHVFSASYFSFLLAPTPAVLIGHYFRKKVLLNYHSGEAQTHLLRSGGTVKKILRFVDNLVVPSIYLKEVFTEFGIDCEVVHNFVYLEQFPFKKREVFKPRFIVTRSLEPIYNIECVLKAFNLIQTRFPEAELFIVGSGSQEEFLKSLSAQLKLRNVLFTGMVEHSVIRQYYQRADFMLNSSNVDNMPISILEAFSSGIPVISSEAGGIPFLITDGHNGMLVPLDDEKGMAKKAIYLLENQEVALGIADEAFRECVTSYSWEANRDRWLDLYT